MFNDKIYSQKMDKTIEVFQKELTSLRTGRANASMLDLVTEELKNSGKPEEIAQKISLGKMNKFKEDNSLLTQAWVMEPKKKVQDIVKELNIPDLKINDFFRIKIGE